VAEAGPAAAAAVPAARAAGGSVPMSRPAPESVPMADESGPGAESGNGSGQRRSAGDMSPDDMSRGGAVAAGAAVFADKIVAIEMQGEGPLVVREKVHAACPMTIDQALFEMELVGHDFFLFTDTIGGLPSVVYRRRGYQYGVIRLVEEAAAAPAGPGSGLANGRSQQAANLASG
jgi:hypothetical protein